MQQRETTRPRGEPHHEHPQIVPNNSQVMSFPMGPTTAHSAIHPGGPGATYPTSH
jgi:hypothetical protein